MPGNRGRKTRWALKKEDQRCRACALLEGSCNDRGREANCPCHPGYVLPGIT